MRTLKHTLSLYIGLFVLWLLLSGQFSPLLLILGLFSAGLTTLLVRRMERLDNELYPLALSPRLPGYWLWLLKEIVVANFAVIRCICQPRLRLSPRHLVLLTQMRSDVGRTILANSITLTPGTVTLSVDAKSVEVHALTSRASTLLMDGQMERHVPDFGGTS